MKSTLDSPKKSSSLAIAALAYELWEKEGRPEGRSLELWQRAKTQLAARADAESVDRKHAHSTRA